MFHHPTRPSDFVRRTLTLAAVLGASFAVATAQTGSAPAAMPQSTALNLQVPPVDTSDQNLFSSSSESAGLDEVASNAGHLNLPNAMVQYGGGRYGGPRYRGGNTNQDGSNKYEFYLGAGFTQPVGNTYHYYTPYWGIEAGAGRNFNKNVGVNVEFNYDTLNLNYRTLSEQSFVYFGDTNPTDNGLDGNAHIWSFTLNPIYNIAVREGLGAYLTAGVGFYHKVTNFTIPEEGESCDYIYGCYLYEANANVDHYTSNAVGFNGGFGLTYKLSRFSNERLFGEVRYVVTLNSQRQGLSFNNIGSYGGDGSTYTGTNYFPANSNRTTYLPIKFGIRF
jgi:hypothetical protein